MIHRGQIETISLSRLGEAELFIRIPGPLEWADLPKTGTDAVLLTGENASAQFPAILGKGDRFTDASSGVIWEVLSVDHGALWVHADVPQPDQEVTAMPPITDTRYTVTSLAFKPGETEVHVVANDATATPTDGGWVPNFQFKCPVEMAPRIGEVITMSWGDPL